MRWLAVILLLTIPIVAQAPPDNLDRAMETLHKEIELLRSEVKSLKEQEAKEDQQERQAREVQTRRKARPARARREVREARRQKPIPKVPMVAVHIKSHEEQIKQNELILAQLDSQPIAPSQATSATDNRKIIAGLVLERNELRGKVKRANGRRFCRWFHIGCIGRK